MIRLVFLLRRRPELSLEDFQNYWRDQHGPLVASHQGALGILRYTQSHRLEDPANERMGAARGGMEPPYDGAAELWFASEAALAEAGATDAGRAAGKALLADEATFIDLPHSPLWLAHEYPQINPNPETVVARPKSNIVKLHFPLRHVGTLGLDEAQQLWRVEHGPLIRSMAPAMGMLRYMQVHRFDSPLADAMRAARGTVVDPYTGHAEAWTDRSAHAPTPEARAANRAAIEDERRFIDFTRSTMWLSKEHVIVDRW
ncbi:MAG: EthD domain-containing protein [Acidimicrobiales bacterium]|nr:EthD domain-containing protein [Acidimicrobiales bacterium]